jgi:TPR repeat protein
MNMKPVTMDHVNKLVKAEKYVEAFSAVLPIAETGNALAQHCVAKLFSNGRGVAQDLEKALDWFVKAADQNNVDSQYNVAQMLLNGEGTRRSYDKAYYWLRRANSLGDAECGEQMAVLDASVRKEDRGSWSLFVNGFEFEDMAGALIEALDDMEDYQYAELMWSLHKNWGEFINKAKAIAEAESADDVTPSMLADTMIPAHAYQLLADIYEYRLKMPTA